MPRELLMMQNSFQWGTAEGQMLEIEYAIRSNIRDLKIEGQTYQNLLGETKDIEYVSTKSEFNYIYTLDNLTANTTYTLSYEIKSSNEITTNDNTILFRIEIDKADGTAGIPDGFTGTVDNIYRKHNLTFNTESNTKQIKINLRNYFNNPDIGLTENTLSVRNLVLLEGDYTNRAMITELPTSINGIESVAEREKESDSYRVTIAQSNNETDGITLSNGVKNTIENGEHIKRVRKLVITSTSVPWANSLYGVSNDSHLTYVAHGSLNNIKHVSGVNTNLICDKLPVGDLNEEKLNYNIMVYGHSTTNKELRIAVPKTVLPNGSIDEFKTWIDANSVTIYYELETPITEPVTTTEILLPQPLRSLPNGVRDTVEGNKLIQRVYELKLDENFDFNVSVTIGAVPTDKTLYRFDIKPPYPTPIGDINSVISNMFPYLFIHNLAGSAIEVKQECVCNHSVENSKISIIIKKERLKSVDVSGFKEWCIANDFKILYQLETPIEHTINIPPISISKGTNMVSTNNNIKPELTCKYKQSTKIIKYLYNLGNEYLNITGGWNTQLTASYGAATTIVKNSNNIYFPTGVWNVLLTNNKIDVTNYDVVYMKYSKEYSSFMGHPARCAIKLGNKNTSWTDFADDATTGALIGKDETGNNVTNGILTIDVSNVTGSYYVGIGGQSNNITVHEIGLKKNNSDNSDTTILYSSGNENTSLTGGYLTSSNNSATCNIEKQADNLYVNCTGKQSFDSMCYARTNKTIKPCKIKVSIKNNYISANGVAFCMFLSEKETISTVSEFNSIINKKYIKASNTTLGQYIDLEIDLTGNTEGYFYVFCMIAGSADYACKANISKIEIIR